MWYKGGVKFNILVPTVCVLIFLYCVVFSVSKNEHHTKYIPENVLGQCDAHGCW